MVHLEIIQLRDMETHNSTFLHVRRRWHLRRPAVARELFIYKKKIAELGVLGAVSMLNRRVPFCSRRPCQWGGPQLQFPVRTARYPLIFVWNLFFLSFNKVTPPYLLNVMPPYGSQTPGAARHPPLCTCPQEGGTKKNCPNKRPGPPRRPEHNTNLLTNFLWQDEH